MKGCLVLALVPAGDRARLTQLLGRYELDFVRTSHGAKAVIADRPVAVLVCDVETATDWKEMLGAIPELRQPPVRVIMVSRTADYWFWGEAVKLGADDVFDKSPASMPAMVQAVGLAAEHWSRA
jgi:DNA-binding NarL/FixJ family response regulator